ncbi:Fc.00g041900.m01.CDS01 [Cosmosporella sp. VM-42]
MINAHVGYDGLHPNAWGEFLIANTFSQTLVSDLELGSSALTVPSSTDGSLTRDLPGPSKFKVFSSLQGVTATWDPVYGAYSYDVKVSINGGVVESQEVSQFNRWDTQNPLEGWTYDVSVRASGGDFIKGEYTGTQTATSKPQLAPPPQNIKFQSIKPAIITRLTTGVNYLIGKRAAIANVTQSTCNEEYFLSPGAWNYAFAVFSLNGDDESAPGKEVVAPSASGAA